MMGYKEIIHIGPGKLFFLAIGVIVFSSFSYDVASQLLTGNAVYESAKYGIKVTGAKAILMQGSIAVGGFLLILYALSGLRSKK